MPGTPYSTNVKKAAVKYAVGHGVTVTAKRYGAGDSTVLAWCRKAGVKPLRMTRGLGGGPPVPVRTEGEKWLICSYFDNHTAKDTAIKFGLTEKAVIQIVFQYRKVGKHGLRYKLRNLQRDS